MQNEFDKEIDALLRKAADAQAPTAIEDHLDADEISLFAENALTGNSRARAVTHFADCGRCRGILASVSALNAEEGIEFGATTVPAAAATVVETETTASWFSNLFKTRNLAIAFGSLAVLFAGFIGFSMIQQMNNSGVETAQADKEAVANKTNRRDDSVKQTADNANISDIAESDEDIADSKDGFDTSNEISPRPTGKDLPVAADKKDTPLDAGISKKEVALAESKIRINSRRRLDDQDTDVVEESDATSDAAARTAPKPAPAPVVAGQTESAPVLTTRGQRNRRKETREEEAKTTPPAAMNRDAQKSAGLKAKKALPTRSVSGKTFTKRKDGWYDAAYKKQRPTVVLRGTSAYGSLDSGLRKIGNTLPGTVFVIWKTKAYKIQ